MTLPRAALGLAAASSVVAALAGLPLVWDGSVFLFTVLNEQRPLLVFHRVVEYVLTAPVLVASWATSDLAILRTVFGLTYAAVPVVALAASWAVVRRQRPDLFVWPMLGTGLALLPGRAVFIAESLIAAQLSWPLLLAAAIGVERRLVPVCVAIGCLVALSHPVAAVFLLIVGVVGWVGGRASRAASAWLAGSIVLAGVNVALMGARLEPYEAASLRPETILVQLAGAAIGPQLAGLLLTALAACLCYRAGREEDPASERRLHQRAAIAVALASAPLMLWAAIPDLWRYEIDFRSLAVPLTVPLFLLAGADARTGTSTDRRGLVERRLRISALASAVMFAVIVTQSVVWTGLRRNVETAMAGRRGCVPAESVEGFASAALGSWTIVPLSIVLQGRDVRAFVAPGALCASAAWPEEIPMVGFPAIKPLWFRFRYESGTVRYPRMRRARSRAGRTMCHQSTIGRILE